MQFIITSPALASPSISASSSLALPGDRRYSAAIQSISVELKKGSEGEMTTVGKVIKTKVGLLELGKQLDNVTKALSSDGLHRDPAVRRRNIVSSRADGIENRYSASRLAKNPNFLNGSQVNAGRVILGLGRRVT